ncbi:MAG: response regulator [Stellaceae bacterium]
MSAHTEPVLCSENSRLNNASRSSSGSGVRNIAAAVAPISKTRWSKTTAEAVEIPVRRLAAVLAADVAGYSRLMGRNEEGTLERLMAHRRVLVDPNIAEHHGRIVKTTGDGILAEFASVVDAVRCAVEMQRGMAERNSGVPIGERLEFRVGINLSDVIVEGDDIYGDGVNVAARVEALADAGGVFVSSTVHDHVRDRLPFVFEDLGEQQVKNIARPVRVYRIPITENAPAKAPLRAVDQSSLAVLPFNNRCDGPELISVAAQTLRSPRSWPSGSATAASCLFWQEHTIAEAPATVTVIDDDLSVREALGSLLRSVGLQTNLYGSVPEFLKAGLLDGPTCLVLDVRLPGQSGLDFQRELSAVNIRVPIIFITGYGDIPMSVRAIKGGAIEFLTKPFRDQDLLDAIQQGLARDRAWLENQKASATLRARFEILTPSEREVMALVVTGRLNKQIAYDIGISEITVKARRSQVMRKMQAASLRDLARMAGKLNLTEESPSALKPAWEFGLPLGVYPAADFLPPVAAHHGRREASFLRPS